MIVAAHQPLFLPWLGYFDRMMQADLFIVLDHVQFARRNYQNRTQILLDGRPHWLSVPVQQHSQLEKIVDKQIANGDTVDGAPAWVGHLRHCLRQAYRKAAHREPHLADLSDILGFGWTKLVDLDLELISYLRGQLGIDTPMVRSSELGVDGARSELILNLCQATGADRYLAGMGGSRHYLDRQAFAEAGVDIVWQDFRHPVYAQSASEPFVPGLSSVDLLMTHGAAAGGILREAARQRSLDEPVGAPAEVATVV